MENAEFFCFTRNIPAKNILELDSQNLETLPASVYKLRNLQLLCATDNQIIFLQNEIGNLSNLERLDIYSNRLKFLPSTISELRKLNVLNVSYNQLTILPSEIGKLNKLRLLFAYNNEFTSLPSEIGNLNDLRDLDVSNNNISSLPNEICNLSKLRNLDVSNNNVSILPDKISKIVNLKELVISHNQITHLPISLGKLDLEYVGCSHNLCIEFTITELEESYSLYKKFARERIRRFMYKHRSKILSLSKRNYLYYVTDSIAYMPPTNNKMGIYGREFEKIYEEFLQINKDALCLIK